MGMTRLDTFLKKCLNFVKELQAEVVNIFKSFNDRIKLLIFSNKLQEAFHIFVAVAL